MEFIFTDHYFHKYGQGLTKNDFRVKYTGESKKLTSKKKAKSPKETDDKDKGGKDKGGKGKRKKKKSPKADSSSQSSDEDIDIEQTAKKKSYYKNIHLF